MQDDPGGERPFADLVDRYALYHHPIRSDLSCCTRLFDHGRELVGISGPGERRGLLEVDQ